MDSPEQIFDIFAVLCLPDESIEIHEMKGY